MNPNWQQDIAENNSKLWSAVNSQNTGNTEGNRNVSEIADVVENCTTTNMCEADHIINHHIRNEEEVMDSEDEVDFDKFKKLKKSSTECNDMYSTSKWTRT